MSALDRRNPARKRYHRNVRNAIVLATAIHGVAFAAAPGYVSRPPRMKADVLRIVNAEGSADGPAAWPGPPAAEPPALPAAPVRSQPAAESSGLRAGRIVEDPAAPAPGPRAGTEGPASAAVSSGSGAGGSPDEGPPVFYAYDRAPRATRTVEPAYPEAARVRGIEGTVVINVNIDVRGRITRAWVAEATAPEILVQAALDAVYQYEFAPGSQRDIPVPCTVAIPFQFRIQTTLQAP